MDAELPAQQIVTKDVPERGKSVSPGNFLSFRVGAARIGDRYFIDPQVSSGDFCSELRFESKTVRSKLHPLQYLASEHLVTGFHVRELQVREHVGEQRKKLVSGVVPKIVNPLRPSKKPRTINDI